MSTGALPVGNVIQVNYAGNQLLGVYPASSSASVDIKTRNLPGMSGAIFQADFDDYIIYYDNLVSSVNNVTFNARYSSDGGATWVSSASYKQTYIWQASDGGSGNVGSGVQTQFNLGDSIANAAGCSSSGSIRLINPLSSVYDKQEFSELAYKLSGGLWGGVRTITTLNVTTPMNAIQFWYNSGTIVSGVFYVVGIPKSTTPSAVISQVGRVVQVANFQTGAFASGTTIIPLDNTIPQITEGDQYMTLAFTPTSAANKLKIDIVFQGESSTAGSWISCALFQDSNANALAAFGSQNNTGNGTMNSTFSHFMTAGTILPTTFKVRAGPNIASTVSFNGFPTYGGVCASSITITEILV